MSVVPHSIYVRYRHETGEPVTEPCRIYLRNNGEFTAPGYPRARNVHVLMDFVDKPSGDTLTFPSHSSVYEVEVQLLDTETKLCYTVPRKVLLNRGALKLDLNPFWKSIPFEYKRGGTTRPVLICLNYGAQPPVHVSLVIEWIGCRRPTRRRNAAVIVKEPKTSVMDIQFCRALRRAERHKTVCV